jgi:hypothetical protein
VQRFKPEEVAGTGEGGLHGNPLLLEVKGGPGGGGQFVQGAGQAPGFKLVLKRAQQLSEMSTVFQRIRGVLKKRQAISTIVVHQRHNNAVGMKFPFTRLLPEQGLKGLGRFVKRGFHRKSIPQVWHAI